MPSSASCRIRGTRPTVETVTPRARHAEAARRRVGQAAYGADHGLVVGDRLAHAHEHHVGDASRSAGHLAARERAGAGDDLLDDLGGRHVALQAALAGGAERAGHPAAGLAGDAHRHAVRVAHQHRLDERAVEEPPQRLAGGAPVGLEGAQRRHQRRQQGGDQLVALRGRQVGHLGRVVDQPGEVVGGQLLGAEPGQAQRRRPASVRSSGVEVGQVPRRLLAAARLVEDQRQGVVGGLGAGDGRTSRRSSHPAAPARNAGGPSDVRRRGGPGSRAPARPRRATTRAVRTIPSDHVDAEPPGPRDQSSPIGTTRLMRTSGNSSSAVS